MQQSYRTEFSCGNRTLRLTPETIGATISGFQKGMGGHAHFLFVKPESGRESWIRSTLEGLGYELVDLESSRSGLLRIFIDSGHGITVEDCARVSNHLTRAFAVEGIDYERLEVSSPGLDRPLKRLADYERFAGREASVKLKLPRDGRRPISLAWIGRCGLQHSPDTRMRRGFRGSSSGFSKVHLLF